MSNEELLESCLRAYLKKRNIPYSPRMMEHVINVSEILASWGTDQVVRDAGLFHAVYGEAATRSLNHESIMTREKVRGLIGDEAENIVYTYAHIPAPRREYIDNMLDSKMKLFLQKLDDANDWEINGRVNGPTP